MTTMMDWVLFFIFLVLVIGIIVDRIRPSAAVRQFIQIINEWVNR